MEQNDPDPFMAELNKQGLPYVVLEIDSNGESRVLEDGRSKKIHFDYKEILCNNQNPLVENTMIL